MTLPTVTINQGIGAGEPDAGASADAGSGAGAGAPGIGAAEPDAGARTQDVGMGRQDAGTRPQCTGARAQATSQPASLPAAAGTAAAPLLRGQRHAGQVVARTRDMVAVSVARDDGPALICLTAPTAVRLPCALVTYAPLPQVSIGMPATVGNGRLQLPGAVVTVARWWLARQARVAHPARAAGRAMACPPPDLDAQLLAVATQLTDALSTTHLTGTLSTTHLTGTLPTTQLTGAPSTQLVGAPSAHQVSAPPSTGQVAAAQPPFADAVAALLGLGPGLTPAGDDILAGALTTLRAMGSPHADTLAAAVHAADPYARTTAVSAGLLGYAAQGHCVPQFSALLSALDSPADALDSAGDNVQSPRADAQSPGNDIQSAHRDLLTVGHTSGAALYAGVRCALHHFGAGLSTRDPHLPGSEHWSAPRRIRSTGPEARADHPPRDRRRPL